MQGKRIYGFNTGLKEGEYLKTDDGNWLIRAPGSHIGTLKNHTIDEHQDGTISVRPSILVQSGDGKGGSKETYHGYLTKGVWS